MKIRNQKMKTEIDFSKHIWEGWTVEDFIDALAPQVSVIMNGQSWRRHFKTKVELGAWCADNQPYYKKPVPEVVDYFASLYRLT